ncbi:MAG: hypothetical protein U1B78_05025 [Dehalococcoidia bacterium]|nr:hypothetical protein [Dehalococcoidia bacterium]
MTEIASNNWIGRTHLQKACFFGQEVSGVPLGYDFTIYQYGPYSFGLDAEIQELVAMEAFSVQAPGGYPDYSLGKNAAALLTKTTSDSIREHQRAVESVAEQVAPRHSRDLELLATLLFVAQQTEAHSEAVRKVQRLKPHFTTEDVESAQGELEQLVGALKGPELP